MNKKYYLIFLLFFLFSKLFCQNPDSFTITFENNDWKKYITFDTTGDTNIWTIGKPKGIVFNKAWEGDNAIYTDKSKVSTFPNKSSFSITLPLFGNLQQYLNFGFYFKSYFSNNDSFSLKLDKGYGRDNLLVSKANENWQYKSLKDSIIHYDIPPFSDTFNEWTHVKFLYNNLFGTTLNDTCKLIFTFKFSHLNHYEGLLIDSFFFQPIVVSIEDIIKSNQYIIYPNPIKNQINIFTKKPGIKEIEIIDIYGRTVKMNSFYHTGIQTINVSDITSGIYFLKIHDEQEIFLKTIIINN